MMMSVFDTLIFISPEATNHSSGGGLMDEGGEEAMHGREGKLAHFSEFRDAEVIIGIAEEL